MWNRLIKIRDNKKESKYNRNLSAILLRQLNTAGGSDIMKKEINLFIKNKK